MRTQFFARIGYALLWGVAIAMALATCGLQVARAAIVTVCASGCDQTTIQAGVNAASSSDTVEIRDSGTYTEQVSRTVSGITIQALAGQTPVIDAQNTRASCILGYTSWVISGITCVNTTGSGFAGNGGSRDFSVYGCTLHDIGAHGITTMSGTPTIARTIIYNVTNSGIAITASADINNVLVYAYGSTAIQATGTNASVSHCTVYGGTAGTYCIQATGASGTVRYSVAQSCYASSAAIRGTGATMYNNAHDVQGGGTAYYLGAPGTGDTSVDSQLVSPTTDFHPAKGSPLIDSTVGSSQTVDVYNVERDGTPDKGAVEYIPSVVRPYANGIGVLFDGGQISQCYSNGF